MAKLSAGQKRQQKAQRRKKKQLLIKQKQAGSVRLLKHSAFPKLSERLMEFGGEMLEFPEADRQFTEFTISILVMCWNIGSVNAERASELRASMKGLLEKEGETFPKEMEEQIDILITKRRFLYSADPRFIIGFNLDWGIGSEYRVQVKSCELPEDERYVPTLKNAAQGLSGIAAQKIAEFSEPPTEQEKELMALLDEGADLLEEDKDNSVLAACEVWLKAWEMIKTLYPQEQSLEEVRKLRLILMNWSAAMDMHLHNAARIDSSFLEKGKAFFQEFIEQFPESSDNLFLNYRRGIAEFQFRLGQPEEGEATFAALVEDFPDETWGFIGWGDIYNPAFSDSYKVSADIEKAKRLYRIPIIRELKDADAARERLDALEKNRQQAFETMDV